MVEKRMRWRNVKCAVGTFYTKTMASDCVAMCAARDKSHSIPSCCKLAAKISANPAVPMTTIRKEISSASNLALTLRGESSLTLW